MSEMPVLRSPRLRLEANAPLLVLLTALATLFPFFYESGPLHRPPEAYDIVTFEHLMMAKNLSVEHDWLSFRRRTVDDSGVSYDVYHRFPPVGYVMIKLATMTSPGDLWGQVQAARMLMLALYVGAAVLAYAALALITGRRWLAVAATLAAFGSHAALRTCDMVATEGTTDLFGTMLALHGIARYCFPGKPGVPAAPGEHRRFGQMLAKACAALLLGWHVYALLAPFVGLGAAAALVGRNWAEFRRLGVFGALVLLFGLAVLAQNLAREHIGLDGGTPVWDLPSLRSARNKSFFGYSEGFWLAFVADQLWRTGLALVPYAATRIDIFWAGWTLVGALGLATIFGLALAATWGGEGRGQSAARRQARAACLALVPLAVTGYVWATGMRGNMTSYLFEWGPERGVGGSDIFEAMFLVGAPLALISLLGLLPAIGAVARLPGALRRAGGAVCVTALWLAFVASAFHMGRLHRDSETTSQERALHADADAIRNVLPEGSVVAIPRGPGPMPLRRRNPFYFTGHVVTGSLTHAAAIEFVVAPRIPEAYTLTPDNHQYLLYRVEEYRRHRGPPRRIVGQY